MNTFNYFSSKIDQIWNTNFNSSLRANVGVIDVERQGGGLDGGSTFKSAGNAQQRNSILLALKNSYKFGDFLEKRMYNTAVLDGMQKHSTRIVRK
jgi:hypothetical protein